MLVVLIIHVLRARNATRLLLPFQPVNPFRSEQVKMAPKAVSQREESELQAMLERLALENEEIDGDAPEDV